MPDMRPGPQRQRVELRSLRSHPDPDLRQALHQKTLCPDDLPRIVLWPFSDKVDPLAGGMPVLASRRRRL